MISFFQVKTLLNKNKTYSPEDNFRIIDSWTEYDESSKTISQRPLKYMCYELETVDPDTGKHTRFFKAVKFVRVIRIPANAKQSTALMDMQQDVLSAVYETNIHLVTVIANIIKPAALGLLYLYGIQSVSTNIEDAKAKADLDFTAFINIMQGQFRVLELEIIKAEESEWLREKMYGMECMTVIRGIPKANKAGEDIGNKGAGGKNKNPGSEGTLEAIISGLADYEYVLEIISSPVKMETLDGWRQNTEREMTEWNSKLQGQKSYNLNLSLPMMYMANTGDSKGWSKSYSDNRSTGFTSGESFSRAQGQSVGESLSQSFGKTVGQTSGTSVSNSYTQGVSTTKGASRGQTFGESRGMSITNSEGVSFSRSVGVTVGQNQGLSTGKSFGTNTGSNYSLNKGESVGLSHNLGQSRSIGYSQNESVSVGNSANVGHTTGTSIGNSFSRSDSVSASTGQGYSNGDSTSNGDSFMNNSTATGSAGISIGFDVPFFKGVGVHASANIGMSEGVNSGFNNSFGSNNSTGENSSASASQGFSAGVSASASSSDSYTLGESRSHNTGVGLSQNFGASESFGTSRGESLSQGWGVNTSQSSNMSIGNSLGTSLSSGTSTSVGNSVSKSVGVNYGVSHSVSQNESVSYGESASVGRTVGTTNTRSLSENSSVGYGRNVGFSDGVSDGKSYSMGNTRGRGISNGNTGGTALGTSASMGLAVSIGYNKSYQWIDQGVKDILEVLEYQNERIKKGRRGQGAFYTYAYLACPSEIILSAAKAVAKATWQNDYAMVQPLQVLDLTEEEQKSLLYRFNAFSADVSKENVFGARQYKYCTVLLPEEYVAYTHIPRVSEGGVFAIVQDVPKFSTPSEMKGEIYMGTILNPERYTFKNGYRTPFDYRVDESSLMHGFFTGASRSGKTVAAMRFVAELAHIKRKRTGKRLRIVVMDPKQDWRTLARFVEADRFNFYSMGNPNFHPVKINPWKVPQGVNPQVWIDGIIDIYCRSYGLLERGKQMIATVVYALYKEKGVFDEDKRDRVQELSSKVCFEDIYKRMEFEKANLENPNNKTGKAGNDTRDAYARLLERLSCFSRSYSIEHKLYGTTEGVGIDELIGKDDVTVLESKGLENTFKNFIFGAITSGFFKYAVAHDGGFLADDQYETVLVIEEANEILIGSDTSSKGGDVSLPGESEFEQILDQSAGYGLFVFAITQKISDMPTSVIANSGLVFAGRLKRTDDINVVVRTVGREERMDDRDLVKWFPRCPTGWFVCQTSRTFDFKDAEPILVQIARLNVNTPTNIEIETIEARKRIYYLNRELTNINGVKIKIVKYTDDFDILVEIQGNEKRIVKTSIHAFKRGTVV